MSKAWRGLDVNQRKLLNEYIENLGPYLMEGFSSVPRNENRMLWDEVNHTLKGHLRTSIFKSIMDTVSKLDTTPKLQGKLKGIDTDLGK